MSLSLVGTASIVLIATILYILSLRHKTLARLYSPLALSIVGILLLVTCLAMGLIRQEEDLTGTEFLTRIGWRSIRDSAWMIGLILLVLVLTGMKSIDSIRQAFRSKTSVSGKFSAVLPLGVFISILGLLMGSLDLERYHVSIWKGNPTWMAVGDKLQEKKLPFAIELQDFRIDYHEPSLFIINRFTGQPLPLDHPQSMVLDGTRNQTGKLLGWKVEIEEYLPHSWTVLDSGTFKCVSSKMEGNCPGAKVKLSPLNPTVNMKDTIRGWVSSGSILLNSAYVELPDSMLMCMAKLKPENYTAIVKIYTMDGQEAGEILTDSIQPNHPLKVGRYQIYLKSYKESHGFWDPYVKLEIIIDPWKYIVYLGIGLVLLGLAARFLKQIIPSKGKTGKPDSETLLSE